MSIDLEQLRGKAFAGQGKETVAVSRDFLRQVHDELAAGRVAQAQLNRARTMDEVIHDLRMHPVRIDPSERATSL